MVLRRKRYALTGLQRGKERERGIALITTLLLLMLLTALSLAMVMSVRADMLINGYYRNFRGSFYAADSGLNVVRRDVVNQLMAAIPVNFNPLVSPMPAGEPTVVQNAVNAKYNANFALTSVGQAAQSWPEKFQVTSFSLTPGPCTLNGGNPGATCAAPAGNITSYVYLFKYNLTVAGKSAGSEAATLTDNGTIQITANLVPAGSKTSFAAWGMFIDNFPVCSGTLVPGTITGPVFTNGAWTFASPGSYIFTDTVGSASPTAGYQVGGTCSAVPASSNKIGNTTIAPTFKNGFNLGQPPVPLPTNDFNQQRAVLDGKGAGGGAVSPSEMNNTLRNINKAQYPNSATKTPGVWLPYTINGSGTPVFTGGGIMVEGNANIVLSTVGTSGQSYTITQGTTTTTIIVDPAANGGLGQTTVQSGSTTLNISGVPDMFDPATGALQGPSTMLYVDGAITALSGPGQGIPAIQDHTALTITAASNVTITGDILYKTEPVTLTANGTTPADTLIPGNDKGQALGIFTAKGDIQMNNKQANGNLEIDASIATISQGGTGGLVNVGNPINTLTIVGGRIQNNIKNIGATTRNVMFDRRYANGFAPPWFPSTTVTLGGVTAANVVPFVTRRQWQNKTSYF